MKLSSKGINFGILLIVSFIQLYMMATVYMQAISPIFQILFWGSVLASVAIYLIRIIKKDKKVSRMEIFYFLYLIYIMFSIFRIKNMTLMVYGIYEYVIFTMSFFSIAFLISNKFVSKDLIDKSIRIFSLLTTIIVGLALFEFKTGHPIAGGITHVFGDPNLINIRAQVFSGSPLIFGTLTASYALIFQYLYMKKKELHHLYFLIVSLTGVILSGSRGPLVALIVASFFQFVSNFPLMNIINRISKKNKTIIIVSFSLFVVAMFIFLQSYSGNNPILLKIISIVDWNSDIGNTGRLNTWSTALEEFMNNWFIGRGISTTGSVTLSHPMNIGVTESSLLKVLVELGILGFIFYFGILITTFIKGITSIRYKDIMYRNEIVLCLSLMILIFIEGSILQITEIFNAAVILWSSAGGVYFLSKKVEK